MCTPLLRKTMCAPSSARLHGILNTPVPTENFVHPVQRPFARVLK